MSLTSEVHRTDRGYKGQRSGRNAKVSALSDGGGQTERGCRDVCDPDQELEARQRIGRLGQAQLATAQVVETQDENGQKEGTRCDAPGTER